MGASVIYPNEIYTAFAFVGFLCSVIPLPWHLQAWNTGTCIFMFWCALSTMNMFVNSIVWHHSVINYAPVWCDISSRIIIGVNVGIPAAMLCVNRRLYHIASIKTVTISRAEKRRGVLIDLAIGLGIPIIDIILAYIPQGHRFNIYEDVGCWTAIYVTPVAMVLVFSVPFFISFVSAIYAALAVRAFWKQRAQFDKIVASHSNCTKNRYLRLMALGLWEVLVNLPLTLYVIVANAAFVSPWLGWADTHLDFGRIDQVPHVLWATQGAELELTRWLFVLCPYVFFFFFGFAEEARKHYRSAYQTVTKATGLSSIGSWGNSGTFFGSSKGSTTEVNSSGGTLPVYVKRDIHRKRDTLDSISDMTTSICDDASINEKAHDEKFDVPDYDNIVLPIAGGVIGDLKADEATPSPSSSNSSRVSLPQFLVSPPHNARPDSGIIEISSIREDAPIKVSDKESRV